MYRDSPVWWVVIAGSLVAYLMSVPTPPTEWTYPQWLQFAAAVISTVAGVARRSPLDRKGEEKDK